MRIGAPVAKVWDALTNPDIVKEYLFGTTMTADWRVGGEIRYTGEWEDKKYEDKGKILEIVPAQRLVTTYWSSAYGKPDIPENYKTITQELKGNGDETLLTLAQDNNENQQVAEHSKNNWQLLLNKMKEVVEGEAKN